MSINSFRKGYVRMGPRFRTPSPPRDAYEPLTPPPQILDIEGAGHNDWNKDPRLRLPTLTLEQAGDGLVEQNEKQQSPNKRSGSPHGSQSHGPTSPIDTLANAASSAAPSPVFGSVALHLPHNHSGEVAPRDQSSSDNAVNHQASVETRPQTSESRPNKRARSELLPSPEHFPQVSRPSTSHTPSHQWSYNVEQAVDAGTRPYEDVKPPAIEHRRHPSEADLEIAQSLLHLFNSTPRPAAKEFAKSAPLASVDAASGNQSLPRTSTIGLTVSSAVQTHTPPEEFFALTAQSDVSDIQANRKSRVEGSQTATRGKSGRRRSSASGRKMQNAKRSKEKEASGVPREVPEQLHSPQSLGMDGPADQFSNDVANGSSREGFMAAVKAEATSKPRRLSTSNLNIPSLPEGSASEQNRAASVPPNTTMVIDGRRQKQEAPTAESKADEQVDSVTICAGCHFASTWKGETNHWISCDGCGQWFHFACAGFKNEREVRSVDKFFCRACRHQHGPTTYVRKSKRTHAAVDYAGLNEGVIRTPEDSHEHHYIQRIKEGGIDFLPEKFPRMRPELLTLDFFEKGSFTEPTIIPASLNPRPHVAERARLAALHEGTEEQEEQETLMGEYEYDFVPDEGQDALDMVIPEGLTVRRVAELYGPEQPVEVIEVKSQEGSDKRWNMQRWAEYYEEEGDKVIRNVISLEISASKLGRLIRRPKIVRDLDLQDSVWPQEEFEKGVWPKVQFYCLMSVADCYTDFHIDFGGSSVYYHIVKGNKTFFFIPPTQKNLKQYEEWCLSPAQNWTFLGDHTKECYRVDLSEGDTMLIPSGWIHAVWTPTNSLVIGGNFLTRLHYETQIKVAEIEKATKVARKFRYPFFQKIMWYTVLKYLEDDPLPQQVAQVFHDRKQFPRQTPIYLEPNNFGRNSRPGPENYNARYYSKAELDGLPALVKFIWRTVRISLGAENNVTMEVRNAVSKSIPKGRGDPLEIIKTFAAWTAWKRGNENIPDWAHSDAILTVGGEQKVEKKVEKARPATARQMPDRKSISEIPHSSPSSNMETPQASTDSPSVNNYVSSSLYSAASLVGKHLSTPKTSQLGPKRIACDACRKRRIRCKHKDDVVTSSNFAAQRFGPNSMQNYPDTASDAAALRALAGQAAGQLEQLQNGTPAAAMMAGQGSTGYPDVMMDSRLILDASHFESGDNKKGRNKACVDCRRSKRRCIHDENGAIDPIKAQEAKIPRGSHKKRRVSGEETSPSIKRSKKESMDSGDMSNGISSAEQLEDGHPLSDGLTEIAMAALGAEAADNDLDSDQEMLDAPPLDPALESVPHQDTAVSSIENHYAGVDQHQDLRLLSDLEESAARGGGAPDQHVHFPGQANGVTELQIPLSSPLTDTAASPRVKLESNGIKSEPGSAKAVRHSSRASKVPERFSAEQDRSANRVLQTPRPVSRGKSQDMPPSSAKKKSPMQKHRKETPRQEKKAVAASSSPKSKQELEEEASRKLARELQELEFGLRRRSK